MANLFGDVTYSREDKRRELKRELRMREEVYERSVAAKKMRAELAEFRIGVMKAILADYEDATPAGNDGN